MEERRVEYRKHIIVIEYDNKEIINPRTDWDNLGTIAYKHSGYNLGEETIDDPIEWLGEQLSMDTDELYEYAKKNGGFDSPYNNTTKEQLLAMLEEQIVILPVYLYDHSGLTIATRPFNCPWDSGQIGYIYCTLEKAIENWGLPRNSTWSTTITEWYGPNKGKPVALREVVERILEGEIKTFDQLLTGEVFGFRILDKNKEETDSCWGYFGSDSIPDMIEECKRNIDNDIARSMKVHYNKVKTWIKNRVPLYVRESNQCLINS